MLNLFMKIISIPRTIVINFVVFPLKIAIKLPILINNNVRIKGLKRNSIVIKGDIKPFMIKIGFYGSPFVQSFKSKIYVGKNSKIHFSGSAILAEGIRIYVSNENIYFGKKFYCNKNCHISSDNDIQFGDNVLIGWNVNIRDTDGHKIITNNNSNNKDPQVVIGNHVWICACVDILKGTKIGNDCIIGYRSCCTELKSSNNQLICGYPAKIIKDNVNWEK